MIGSFWSEPSWVSRLESKLDIILRKVAINMALDNAVLLRVLAGAQSLAEQAKAAAEREKAKDAEIARLSSELGQAETAIAEDAKSDEAANKALADTADALDKLVKGPETPAVETPLPDEAPAVVDGSQEPSVVSEEPQETPAEAPASGENA